MRSNASADEKSQRPTALGPDGAKLYAEWQAFDDKIDVLNKQLQKKKDAGLAAEIKLLKAKPPPKPPLVMAVAEREVIADANAQLKQIYRPS